MACVEDTGSALYVAKVTHKKLPNKHAVITTAKALAVSPLGSAMPFASVVETLEPTWEGKGRVKAAAAAAAGGFDGRTHK